ncbi:MAG: hypothetical protein NC820_05805 [Candidatus Omnitrophica bacterium]|nr:hypothetical protein [Candidatus Omnitrophota bacterium]
MRYKNNNDEFRLESLSIIWKFLSLGKRIRNRKSQENGERDGDFGSF